MSNDLYSEKLSWFKENERPEVVLLIADDPELTKIVVAWHNVEVKIKDELSKLLKNSENDVWSWLWENTEYEYSDFVEKSEVPKNHLHKRLPILIGNRILYPDGSVNSYVQKYLKDKVLKLFEAKIQKSRRKV